MQTTRRYLRPLDPWALARYSSRAGQLGMGRGCGLGFWAAIGNAILGTFTDALGGLSSSLKDAHIAAQNLAGDGLAQIEAAFQTARREGTLSNQYIVEAIESINTVMDRFRAFVDDCIMRGACNGDRARAGVRDVQRVADGIIDEFEGYLTEGGAITDYVGGFPGAMSASNLTNALPWILGAAFLFMLPKIGKYS